MIQNKLLKWFDLNKRNLPWRHGRNPYRVWVAEIMLQQTQVKTVIPYFKKWMKKYPTLKSLRNAEYDKVLKCGKVWGTILDAKICIKLLN